MFKKMIKIDAQYCASWLLSFVFNVLLLFSISGSLLAQSNVVQMNVDNVESLALSGPDATGGIGDWWLTNGTLCAVISDIDHEGEFSKKGGTLIDLGFCGRSDDHMTWTQSLLDGERLRPLDVHKISIQTGINESSIITVAENEGVEITTRYSLRVDEPHQLFVTKEMRILDEDVADFNFFTHVWFNYLSLETFLFSSTNAEDSRGFSHVDFVTRGVSALDEAPSIADTIVFLSGNTTESPIAYGWQILSVNSIGDHETYALPAFFLSDEESTVLLTLSDDFYLGSNEKIGLLQLPQIPLLSLDEDHVLEIKTAVHVGAKSDVAVITDRLIDDAIGVVAQTPDVDSVLHVFDSKGNPVTFVRPNDDGYIEFKLKRGDYVIEHRGSAQRSITKKVSVADNTVDLGNLILPKTSQLETSKAIMVEPPLICFSAISACG